MCLSWLGCGSNPSEFPRFPDEEEIGGEMNLVGPGGSSGYGVDEDTGMWKVIRLWTTR